MFYESRYPKKELKDIAKQLMSFSNRFLLHESWGYKLEKICFIWFYFVRKLIESKHKVTDDIRLLKIKVCSYKFIWQKRLYLPVGAPDEYDYESPVNEILTIRELSNQIVHSQLFFSSKEWKGLKYIYVSSDKKIYDRIYAIDIKDVIDLFMLIGFNDVKCISMTRTEEGGVITKCK